MAGRSIGFVSFNRTVTQRVGALDDHFLARDRPLGESRLLWEIGEDGCDVRRLRAALDLDSGYLSRLLRSLEADGLVSVAPSPADKRVRTPGSPPGVPSGSSWTGGPMSWPGRCWSPWTSTTATGWWPPWGRSSGC